MRRGREKTLLKKGFSPSPAPPPSFRKLFYEGETSLKTKKPVPHDGTGFFMRGRKTADRFFRSLRRAPLQRPSTSPSSPLCPCRCKSHSHTGAAPGRDIRPPKALFPSGHCTMPTIASLFPRRIFSAFASLPDILTSLPSTPLFRRRPKQRSATVGGCGSTRPH